MAGARADLAASRPTRSRRRPRWPNLGGHRTAPTPATRPAPPAAITAGTIHAAPAAAPPGAASSDAAPARAVSAAPAPARAVSAAPPPALAATPRPDVPASIIQRTGGSPLDPVGDVGTNT